MNKLRDLAEIANAINPIRVAGQIKSEDSKMMEFYNELLSGNYDQKHALENIYGFSSQAKTFQKIKDRLRNKMTSQILCNNLSRHFKSDYSNARYNCISNIFAGNVLMMKGKRDTAIDLYQLALNISEKYYFTDLQLMCLRILRVEANRNADKKKTSHYKHMLRETLNRYNIELMMEEYYNEIISPFVLNSNPKDKEFTGEDIITEVEKLYEENNSFNVRLYYYRIMIKYHHLHNRNQEVINICDEALQYLEKNKLITPEVWLGEFTLEKMENLMLLRNFKDGVECSKRCDVYFSKFTINRLIYKEYHFLLCMRTGNYFTAGQVYKETVNKTFATVATNPYVEKWKIFRCFLSLVQPAHFKNMRNAAIDPEVFATAQDKTGYNLAIKITELIHLLSTNHLKKFELFEGAFDKYVQRHIKQKESPRSFYFCKMILCLFKYSLDRKKIISAAKVYKDKLASYKELEHFEVIPYEEQWEFVIRTLESLAFAKETLKRVG